MSTLLSGATGNFTAAATWALCDPTSELDSNTTQTTVGTTSTDSSAFTPGAITVDGIAIKLFTRAASPTGTLNVKLRNSTDSVDVDSVTVNVSDMPANTQSGDSYHNGWIFFKFGSSSLLLAGKSYIIRLVTSSASQIVVHSNGGNLSRQLRTTTAQAPAASDKLIITGTWTAAATSVAYTVTMDSTAATTFGTVAMLESLTISQNGTLSFGIAASTAYLLKVAGYIYVATGGALNIGTGGGAMPSTSSGIIDFVNTANTDSGLRIAGGTVVTQGATKTTITTVTSAANSGQAIVNVADVTGWAAPDDICLTATERSYTQFETRVISSIATLAVTVTANFTNKHSGAAAASAPNAVRGHVGMITHNVKIRGASNTLRGFIYVATNGSLTMRYTEMKWLGQNTTLKHGVSWATVATFDVQYCSLWNFGWVTTTGTGFAAFTFSNNVLYNADNNAIRVNDTTTATAWTISGNLQIGSNSNYGMVAASCAGTITNNIFNGNGTGISIAVGGMTGTRSVGTFSGNDCNNNQSNGISVDSVGTPYGLTITTNRVWRNASFGLYVNAYSAGLIVDGMIAFGNTTAGIGWNYIADGMIVRNSTFDGETSFAQAHGCYTYSAVSLFRCYFETCDFAQTTAHGTDDLGHNNTPLAEWTLVNCRYGAGTVFSAFSGSTNWLTPLPSSFIRNMKYGRTAGDNRTQTVFGITKTDTVIFNTASPSERLTPREASYKLVSGSKIKVVDSGGTLTASVYVRKSVVGDTDGANYNGAQPRLIMRRNFAVGLTVDVVLDTMTAAIGSWELLTGTTPTTSGDVGALEFYVDCDGTAGWVNVDDWTIS